MLGCRATGWMSHTGGILRGLSILVALVSSAFGQVRNETATYASGTAQVTVEVFAPDRPVKSPAVLLLHGSGGLEQATGDVFREIAATLASRGYVALIPHYFESTAHAVGRPFRNGEYEAWLQAVADAIEFAAARPDVDPARFAVIGYSMGSNLATFRATKDPRIKAISSISGSYPPIKPSKKLPPLLILHGSKDQSTPLEYVKKYVEALKEQEMPHAVHIYAGMGHNFDIPRFGDATKRSVAFFDKFVKPTTGRSR